MASKHRRHRSVAPAALPRSAGVEDSPEGLLCPPQPAPAPPLGLSADASVILDVRMATGVRPMRFPLLCTIHQVLEMISCAQPIAHLPAPALYVTRSGVWLDEAMPLYACFLDNLEEVVVEAKRDTVDEVLWQVSLPDGSQVAVACTSRTTPRGVIQLLPYKPPGLLMDKIQLYIHSQPTSTLAPAGSATWRAVEFDQRLPVRDDITNFTNNLKVETDGLVWPARACVPPAMGQSHSATDLGRHLKRSQAMSGDTFPELPTITVAVDSPTEPEPRERHHSCEQAPSETFQYDRKRSFSSPLEPEQIMGRRSRRVGSLEQSSPRYPAFADLVEVARQEQETRDNSSAPDSPKGTLSTLPGSPTGFLRREIHLKVLVEHTSEVWQLVCTPKDKVQLLIRTVLAGMGMGESADLNYSLYLPVHKRPAPFTASVKSLGLRTSDLLILLNNQTASPTALKKKKPTRYSYNPRHFLPALKPRDGGSLLPPWFASPPSESRNRHSAGPQLGVQTTGSPGDVLRGKPVQLDLLQKLIQALLDANAPDEEGIFRVSARAAVVHTALNSLVAGEELDLDGLRTHEVAGVLKKYLRESTALIPEAMLPAVVATHNGEAVDIPALWRELGELGEEEQLALAELVKFLYCIAMNSQRNLMTIENLAMVFCPVLLREAPTFDLSRTSMLTEIAVGIIQYATEVDPSLPKLGDEGKSELDRIQKPTEPAPNPPWRQSSDPNLLREFIVDEERRESAPTLRSGNNAPAEIFSSQLAAICQLVVSQEEEERVAGVQLVHECLQVGEFADFMAQQHPRELIGLLQRVAAIACAIDD